MALRFRLFSDLHLEFEGYKWNIPDIEENYDLIILAGDIGNSLRGIEWAIRQSEKLTKTVLFVAGNHDLYNDDIATFYESAKEYVKNTNVHVLEKDIFQINEYTILGCSLFTDYKLYGPVGFAHSISSASKYLSDHTYISNAGKKFTPKDALHEFNVSFQWIKDNLTGLQDILVTHHALLAEFIGPQYRGDIMSPCFASDGEGFILERQPLLVISGHTHWNLDMMIGRTRVVSNQRGYKNEGVVGFNSKLIIEI